MDGLSSIGWNLLWSTYVALTKEIGVAMQSVEIKVVWGDYLMVN